MNKTKSSLNPQVRQLEVSQPPTQLSFLAIRFPSSSVLPPSSVPAWGEGVLLPSVLHSTHPYKTFVYYAKESPLPKFSPSECLEYRPLTALVGLEGIRLSVNPSAR